MKEHYLREIRAMSPQQRFEKLLAINELSYNLKSSNRSKDLLNSDELEK